MGKEQPFRDPLRQPGQSTYEELLDIADEQVIFYVMAVFVAVLLAGFEWVRWYFHIGPHPWYATGIAAVFIVYVAIRTPRHWRMVKNLRLGARAERMVGQELERLRGLGYEVFHDVVADGFNIDHVVIGRGGVFTVETKARSKPNGGVVECKGDVVTVAGHTPDRDPIVQAKSQARWVSDLLERGAGLTVQVRPVVLFPGWFINGGFGESGVWILNENSFRTLIKDASAVLSAGEARQAALALETYIRSRS
jgi:hypothetical protein